MSEDAHDEIGAARRAEGERRRRGLARIALIALACALACALIGWLGSGSDLESHIAAESVIEEREAARAPRVLDPGCRALAERVGAFAAAFEREAAAIEGGLGAGAPPQVREAIERVGALREAIESARIASQGARYQYDESASEVRAWLGYVDRHLQGWERHGAERLEAIEAQEEGGAPVEVDLRAKKKKEPRSKASLKERRARVALGVREALAEFRVWQQDGGARNPCALGRDL